ncbi:MAG: ATP-dependent DNA ligase [Candidatus Woesearchaeota archaeon]
MNYSDVVKYLEKINATSKNLEKIYFIAKLIKSCDFDDLPYLMLFLQGLVFKETEQRDLGISVNLILRLISILSGLKEEKIVEIWKREGDVGNVAYNILSKVKQKTLFPIQKSLTLKKMYSLFEKISQEEGEGSIERKLSYLKELYFLCDPLESKYLTRLILGQLRLGFAEGLLIDALTFAFLPKDINKVKKCSKCNAITLDYDYCFECKNSDLLPITVPVSKISEFDLENLPREFFNLEFIDDDKKVLSELVEEKYNYCNDLGKVAQALFLAKENPQIFNSINISLFIPVRSMLFVKVNSAKEGLEVVGVPAAVEFKYDGFRVQAHVENLNSEGKIKLFTRNLEEVTDKFPEVVNELRKLRINCILDGEVVGYIDDKPVPFQNISQRIMRKYKIQEHVFKVPVKYHVFDILFLHGQSLVKKSFGERRNILLLIFSSFKSDICLLADQIIANNEEDVIEMFDKAIRNGHEGVMIKALSTPYKPGKRVGYGVKLKGVLDALDLVIVRAEYGEGKRSRWLSSYYVACRDGERLLEVGKVSSGLKERTEEGITYEEMTNLLKPLIVSESGKIVEVAPKIVVSVIYEEIQESDSYSSGYALRFPRILSLREKPVEEISTLEEIKEIFKKQRNRE